MDDKLKINVSIAERMHQITIDRDKEPIYREAAKKLNDLLIIFRKKYSIKHDDKEILSMIAYEYVVKMLSKESKKPVDDTAIKLMQLKIDLQKLLLIFIIKNGLSHT